LKNSLNSSLKDEDFKKLESSIKKVHSFISFRNEKYMEDLKLSKDEYVKYSTDLEGAMKKLKENLNRMEELRENLKFNNEDLSFMGISKNNIELICKIEKMNINDVKSNKDIESKKEPHKGIACDKCGKENFTGKRYKCATCTNYDLCESCFPSPKFHPNNHYFILVKKRLILTLDCKTCF
jgi:hypothetical protein